MARKPTEYVQFKLRIRESLRRRIEREAEKKEQSANNEAVERLERSFLRDEQTAAEKTHTEKNAQAFEWMVGSNEAATDLLRKMIFELQSHPEWDGNKAGRKRMADKIHAFIYPPEIFGKD
jgi:hypothetical protein